MMPPTAGMQMEESAKETVVIVHGTWAAPEPEKTQWYQRPDDVSATDGFVSKLDAALEARGSPARCWAHCVKGLPIFQWSGENSWVARTRAAGALADYLAKVQEEGWRCHIVAHSHGGNVVVEALPQITAATSPNGSHGPIVTLGSPFIDTMSPILKRVEHARKILRFATWMALAVAAAGSAWFFHVEREDRFATIYTIYFALLAVVAATVFFGYLRRQIKANNSRVVVQDPPPYRKRSTPDRAVISPLSSAPGAIR